MYTMLAIEWVSWRFFLSGGQLVLLKVWLNTFKIITLYGEGFMLNGEDLMLNHIPSVIIFELLYWIKKVITNFLCKEIFILHFLAGVGEGLIRALPTSKIVCVCVGGLSYPTESIPVIVFLLQSYFLLECQRAADN